MHVIAAGFLASAAAGLATGVGALPSLLIRNTSDRILDTMLGFAAGVMVAASAFSLFRKGIFQVSDDMKTAGALHGYP